MRAYAIERIGFIQHDEISRDLRNKDIITKEFGEEVFIKSYINMCNCTREMMECENYVALGIPRKDQIDRLKMNDNWYSVVKFDYNVDVNDHRVFQVKWDDEKKMPYIEVE